jgi:hypothetical protein
MNDEERDARTAREDYESEQETQTYREAAQLAKWLFKTHYAQQEVYASGRVIWGLCDTTAGVISQIDNMVCKLVLPKESEPVAWADIQKEAQQIVDSKFLWKKFIVGTPLSNDIACWMADFAQQYTTPPQPEPFAPDWVNYRQGKIDGALEALAEPQEPQLPEFYAELEYENPDWGVAVAVYQRRADKVPLLVHREALPKQQPAQREWVDDWKQIEDMPDTFDQGVAWALARLKEKNT